MTKVASILKNGSTVVSHKVGTVLQHEHRERKNLWAMVGLVTVIAVISTVVVALIWPRPRRRRTIYLPEKL